MDSGLDSALDNGFASALDGGLGVFDGTLDGAHGGGPD